MLLALVINTETLTARFILLTERCVWRLLDVLEDKGCRPAERRLMMLLCQHKPSPHQNKRLQIRVVCSDGS